MTRWQPGPPAPVATPEPMDVQQLVELLEGLTVTVAVHPDDAERVQTAADELGACPVRVVANAAVTPGRGYVFGPGGRLDLTDGAT